MSLPLRVSSATPCTFHWQARVCRCRHDALGPHLPCRQANGRSGALPSVEARGRVSIWEPINEVAEQVANRVRASGFYNELQPEWGEIGKLYQVHKEDWWGTLVGWDERDLIGWFEAVGFSTIKVSYELRSGVRTRKPKKADIEAGIRGRPNPNMPSYEEVAREVLGDRADDYLERYVRFLVKAVGARSALAHIYLLGRR